MATDKNKRLTDKQKIFCQEYLIDLNGTKAAIRAGYSPKTAMEQASRLLSNVKVQELVKELKDKRVERCEVTADMILRELASIGFSKITDFLKVEEVDKPTGQIDDEGNPITINMKDVIIFDTDNIEKNKIPAISEIKMTKDGISLKLHDKVQALNSLAKHTGFYEIDNKQKSESPKVLEIKIIPPVED